MSELRNDIRKIDERLTIVTRGITDEAKKLCFKCVVVLLDDANSRIGCAVFITPNTAITCYHNVEGFTTTPVRAMTEAGDVIKFSVLPASESDIALDIAGLRAVEDSREEKAYLPLSSAIPTHGESVSVLGFQIGIEEDLEESFHFTIGLVKSSIAKWKTNHLLLFAATFRGDSGAAVVLVDGALIAMNVAGVNEAKERLVRAEVGIDDEDTLLARLKNVEDSIDSLTSGLAQGSVCVRATAFAHYAEQSSSSGA